MSTEFFTPPLREKLVSQVPAIELLMKLGFHYLSPADAMELRGNRRSQTLLVPILQEQLSKINRVIWRENEQPFSPAAIQSAIAALRDLPDEGLLQTSEKVYDILSLGKSFPQTVGNDTRSFTLRYVDWNEWSNNCFHVTEEFAVERTGSKETYRVDLVLFVNGIPFAAIECKPRGEDELKQAVSQHLRNQREDGIPRLYWYTQILLGINAEGALYATARTPAEFWAIWREGVSDTDILGVLNTALDTEEFVKLFWHRSDSSRVQERTVTPQDRALYCLCRPERLIEFTRQFIVYDAGQKKIARHQQFAAVKRALARVHERKPDGTRQGGIVWHTQGSGKSLTMVMLAKALTLDSTIKNPRLILVTDRVELDKQIGDTFRYCGQETMRAKDGKELRELIESRVVGVITTIINKFERAIRGAHHLDQDENLFVLVDEGHRTNFGSFHALMKKALPRACFIGFTGTPVVIDEKKNNLEVFGDFIHTYTLDHAVEDDAVVPLLYEGRHVEQEVDQAKLDLWFERLMRGKTEREKADFKQKFATAKHLNRAEQRLLLVSWDICEHFRQGLGKKAQLVAPRKDVALRYREIIEEIGRSNPDLKVSAEVLISGPDNRDDYEDCSDAELPKVQAFWKEMMARFGTEERYNESLTSRFKGEGDPELIIVVSKLLTGFDAPANTILYIDKKLTGHTLLQAIARVNRKHEGKDFGYIVDYYGVLGDLNEALTHYAELAQFDEADLVGALTHVSNETSKLPGAYSDLWELFRGVKNKEDDEQFVACLLQQDQRDEFYARLSVFARLFQVALATTKFLQETSATTINRYRRDLKYFLNLRTRLKQRFSEEVDYAEYEKRIQTLIDRHVGATEVCKITPLVNIFDKERFDAEVEKLDSKSSRADTIASRTSKTISENWEKDPAFYQRFSHILQRLIEDYRSKRISDAQYLEQVTDVLKQVREHGVGGLPGELHHRPAARAFYGMVKEALAHLPDYPEEELEALALNIGLAVDDIVQNKLVVNWTSNPDVKNEMINASEDYLLGVARGRDLVLPLPVLNEIEQNLLPIAEAHYRNGKPRQ